MKIIFLDIDGVIHTQNYDCYNNWMRKLEADARGLSRNSPKLNHKSQDQYGVLFDPMAVKWLDYIIRATDAKIVISSSWRHNGIDHLRNVWADRQLPGEIIDITAWNQECKTGFEGSPYEFHRGAEIQEYLNRHADSIESYVIIDDERDMLPTQLPFFVNTNEKLGITSAEADFAVTILNSTL